MKITDVSSLEILDSRGNPTIRTFITLDDGTKHVASVPSGASTGSHEAAELRDKDSKRYDGKGVTNAVENVNTVIKTVLVGMDADPNTIDEKLLELDGTENKTNLGANAILSVSMAVVRASAHASNQPLWKFLNGYYFSNRHPERSEGSLDSSASPQNDRTPGFPHLMVNIVNGGRHANWNFDIQEFMIVPNETLPSKSIRIAAEIFHSLGKVLKQKGLSTLVGDEGGYSPKLNSNEEVLDTIITAAKLAGYENVRDFRISLDCAATEWFENGEYHSHQQNKTLTENEILQTYQILNTKYQILSLEDGFSEDDWEAWKKLTEHSSVILSVSEGSSVTASDSAAVSKIASSQTPRNDNLIIIGDDLFATNPERIKRGIDEKAANAVLIKPNQIGTIKETAQAINMTHDAGWKTAISHRSGETEDSFIADLAYACGSEFIKTGSMSRSERLSKYNRLLEIEQGL
jgi:enolase